VLVIADSYKKCLDVDAGGMIEFFTGGILNSNYVILPVLFLDVFL
jgi:hypothetical protein